MRKERFYWTLETSMHEAEIYSKSGKTRAEFKHERGQAHKMLLKNNLLDTYFDRKQVIPGTWKNYENCYNAAKQCANRTEFETKYPQAYKQSSKNYTEDNIKWLDTFGLPDRLIVNSTKYWTDEKLKEEALKYDRLNNLPGNLRTALYERYGNTVLDVFPHLRSTNIDYEKRDNLVYLYTVFNSKMVCYVGRTTDGCLSPTKSRHKNKSNDAVVKYSKQNNVKFSFRIIAKGLTVEESKETEDLWRNYLSSCGYEVLNIAPTGKSSSIGSLGGGIWKKEKVIEFIKENKIEGRKQLFLANNPAYNACKKNHWLDELFPKYKRYKSLNSCNYKKSPIVQYDKDGCFIAIYDSISEAFRKTGVNNIYNCVCGKSIAAGGYIWKYYNESTDLFISA